VLISVCRKYPPQDHVRDEIKGDRSDGESGRSDVSEDEGNEEEGREGREEEDDEDEKKKITRARATQKKIINMKRRMRMLRKIPEERRTTRKQHETQRPSGVPVRLVSTLKGIRVRE
jgi:hypothetical protein